MFKKLGGLVNKVQDAAPSASSSQKLNSLTNETATNKEKINAKHDSNVLKAAASSDSLHSDSIAPRPHLPSSVYNPNPFPLDPMLPGGLSQFKGFISRAHDEESLDIEVEERRGFVSGKSRQSIEQIHEGHVSVNEVEDIEYDLTKSQNPIQRFKGAFAKSKIRGQQQDTTQTEPLDAVLQHHLQLQELQMRSFQQMDKPLGGRQREQHTSRSRGCTG